MADEFVGVELPTFAVSITPAIFGGTSKNTSGTEADSTGYIVQTTFKF